MHIGRLVFSQVMDFLPKHQFDKCVRRYQGNYRVRRFSCFDQFLSMAFAQLTYRESLRDIEICLTAMGSKLYHAGMRANAYRNTLAKANRNRDWRIYADFAQVLITKARRLYANETFGVQLEHTAYVFDSTTINLCLSLFPWARFMKTKAAVKLHTLMDLRGAIPCFISITDGKTYDATVMDELVPEPGSFYIMDRGYIDFRRLYRIHQSLAFFVVRARKNMDYHVRSRRPIDKSTGLRADQTIVLAGKTTAPYYPQPFRRISFFDADTQKRFVFLTNNFTLHPLTIASLYKCRWRVELFFKWIKQYLRIKAFYGTSQNAVKTQIWIAISIYVLVAIVKKQLAIERSLGEILQILSIALFEKTDMLQLLTETELETGNSGSPNQLILLGF